MTFNIDNFDPNLINGLQFSIMSDIGFANFIVKDGEVVMTKREIKGDYRDTYGTVFTVSLVEGRYVLFNFHWHLISSKNYEMVDVIDEHWPMAIFEGVRIAKLLRQTDPDDVLNILYSMDWPDNEVVMTSKQFMGMEYFKRDMVSKMLDISLDDLISLPIDLE